MFKRLALVLVIGVGIVFVPYWLWNFYDSIGIVDIRPSINFVRWLAGWAVTVFIAVSIIVSVFGAMAIYIILGWVAEAVKSMFSRLFKYIIKGD